MKIVKLGSMDWQRVGAGISLRQSMSDEEKKAWGGDAGWPVYSPDGAILGYAERSPQEGDTDEEIEQIEVLIL